MESVPPNEIAGIAPEDWEDETAYAQRPAFAAGHDAGCCIVCAERIHDMHNVISEANEMLRELKPLIDSFGGQDLTKLASPMGLLSLFAKPKK
jgi:hypothetical protein